ncbi:MAG: hypothetical protein HOC79_05625 [Euryarchaeota archaeon]|nr:hypothetical protein [Euryarchaeota archaeon]
MEARPNTIYTITHKDIRDDGLINRPYNNTTISASSLKFEKLDGTSVRVVDWLSADETLCPAFCSCGTEVNCSRITLVLEDGKIVYPAACCNTIQFFKGDAK